MRLTKLAGLPVVDSRLARQSGVVSDVLVDLSVGRVAALHVRHADGWLIQRIPIDYVYRLDRNTVLVNDTVELDFNPPMAADERWLPTQTLVGLEVLSEKGDRIGQVGDVDLDARTLAVKSYLLEERRLLGRRGKVLPEEVVSFSPEMMIVAERSPRRR